MERLTPGWSTRLAFDEDPDSLVASAGDDGRVVLFNPGSVGARTRQINVGIHAAGVLGVGFIVGKRAIVTSGREGAVKVWGRTNWEVRATVGSLPGPVRGLAFTGNGRSVRALTATSNFRVRSTISLGAMEWQPATPRNSSLIDWDLTRGGTGSGLVGQPVAPLRCMASTPDGTVVAVGGEGGAVAVSIKSAPFTLFAKASSYDLYAMAQEGWRIRPMIPIPYHPEFRPAHQVRSIAVSQDGKSVAAGDGSGVVQIWETATKKLLKSVTVGTTTNPIETLAFSPADGKLLALSWRGWDN